MRRPPPDGPLLIFVGQYRELGHAGAPSLVAARGTGTLRGVDKAAIVDYLRRGVVYAYSPGPARDVFASGARAFAGTMSILTDGVFAWHEVLPHYVLMYDVPVADELVGHAAATGYAIPAELELRRLRLS